MADEKKTLTKEERENIIRQDKKFIAMSNEFNTAVREIIDSESLRANRVTMPEIYFREFVPLLAGFEAKMDDGTPIEIKHWLSVTHSANSEVDVIDNSGNVLFTVPPIISTRITKLREDRGPMTMGTALEQLAAKALTRPKEAEDLLTATLDHKLSNFNQTEVSNVIDGWIYIFKRYGFINDKGELVDPRVSNNQVQSVINNDTVNDPNEDFEDYLE